MSTTGSRETGPCVSCGKPVIKADGPTAAPGLSGVWVHVDPADVEYCDEVAKPAKVLEILDRLQAEREAARNGS